MFPKKNTIHKNHPRNCNVRIIFNLSNLLFPFVPSLFTTSCFTPHSHSQPSTNPPASACLLILWLNVNRLETKFEYRQAFIRFNLVRCRYFLRELEFFTKSFKPVLLEIIAIFDTERRYYTSLTRLINICLS